MKLKSVGVIGKRWFDRVNGNTYNSVEIYVNGRKEAVLPMDYGYGDHFLQRAGEWLIENDYLQLDPDQQARKKRTGSYPPLWQLTRDVGIEYDYEAYDVPRKRDLAQEEWVR
jgi:hypothetical protein